MAHFTPLVSANVQGPLKLRSLTSGPVSGSGGHDTGLGLADAFAEPGWLDAPVLDTPLAAQATKLGGISTQSARRKS